MLLLMLLFLYLYSKSMNQSLSYSLNTSIPSSLILLLLLLQLFLRQHFQPPLYLLESNIFSLYLFLLFPFLHLLNPLQLSLSLLSLGFCPLFRLFVVNFNMWEVTLLVWVDFGLGVACVDDFVILELLFCDFSLRDEVVRGWVGGGFLLWLKKWIIHMLSLQMPNFFVP